MRLGHAVGVERLELVELLAGTREEDRLADDLLHRQRGATARVAVDLGEDHAVEADRLVERVGDVHRFLTGHRVDDEQRVVRLDRGVDRAQLVHQLGVDLETAGGVDDHDVATEPLRLRDRAARDVHRIGRLGEERDLDAFREHAQLLDRGRALEVGADEQRLQALRLQQPRELARGGRLSGALQAREHHDRRRLRAHRELAGRAAERLDELFVHDLDELLAGLEALREVGADRALLHPLDERPAPRGR